MAKVLIADDSEVSRDMLEMLIEPLGHELTVVSDGKEARDLIARNNRFDLVVSDYNMPNMDGLELLKWIREISLFPTVPFILVTANNNPRIRRECERLNATYVEKAPSQIEAISDAVKGLLPSGQ